MLPSRRNILEQPQVAAAGYPGGGGREEPPAVAAGSPEKVHLSSLHPAPPPAPNRSSAHAESASSLIRPMESREVKHHQPLSHSPPVLQPDLHIAQSDH